MEPSARRFTRPGFLGFSCCMMLAGVLLVADPVHPAQGSSAESSARAADETAGAAEFPAEIEKLLTETSDADEYVDMQRCISARSIRNTRILDDRHIVFELPSKKYYLVQFKYRCFRLQRESALIYEPRSGQLCRLDQIRASNNFGMRDIGPPCSIPGFIEVTEEQIALLSETLKARRQSEIDAFEAEKKKKQQDRKAAASRDS